MISLTHRIVRGVVAAAVILSVPVVASAQQAPSTDQILVALQDVDVRLDGLRIRSALGTETGGTALLELGDGTLIDLRLAAVPAGWSVRDISLVAGNAETFRTWSMPWRQRVGAARDFLATMETGGAPQRPAEELAPLSWFEDPEESSRLWGMNPVTYRMMQTLQMLPTLGGPMGAGSVTNPVPRRNDQ